MQLLRPPRLPWHLLRAPSCATLSRPRYGSFIAPRSFSTRPATFARRRHDQKERRQEQELEKDHDDIDVNYFEEDMGPNPKRRRIDTDVRRQEEAERREDDEFRALQDGVDEFDLDETEDMFGAKDKLDQHAANAIFTDLDGPSQLHSILPHHISTSDPLPRQSQIHIDRMNEALDEATLDPSQDKAREKIWRCYQRSKLNVPKFTSIIPVAAWHLIWLSQASDSPFNSERAGHLNVLAHDKRDAGWTLTSTERYAELEGMFLTGDKTKALQLWEDAYNSDDAQNLSFLEMGIRMFAYCDDTARAQDILTHLFQIHPSANPRICIGLIHAYCHKDSEQGLIDAWNTYLDLRRRLNSDMNMADYDAVSLAFFASGNKDYALAVFRDMMLSGDPRSQESTEFYRNAAERVNKLISSSSTIQDANEISLSGMTYLPRRFQNKFFYASWLRKLISQGQLDAAAQVVELMYERGAKPDAKHINGLVSAWLRAGSSTAKRNAENMAWSMIQERIQFVQTRKALDLADGQAFARSKVHDTGEGIKIPEFTKRTTPSASIETFCILLQYYLRRGMFKHGRHLRNLLAEAEIPMNSYFMNHLLFAELRNRGYRHTWSRFEVMSRSVTPDVETWDCLWECMKNHADTTRNTDLTGFPTARQLFARMMDWYAGLQGQQRRDAMGDFDVDTLNDVIRGFVLSSDLEGSFVAMQALNQRFHIQPTEQTVRMLIMQIARLDTPKATSSWFNRKITKSEQNEQRMARTTEVLNLLRQRRLREIYEQGYDFKDMSIEQQAKENHRVLLALLFNVIRQTEGPMKVHTLAINKAAKEMGVEQIDVSKVLEVVVPDEDTAD